MAQPATDTPHAPTPSTPSPGEAASQAARSPGQSLGEKTATLWLWNVGFGITGMVVNAGTQIALAWWLAKEDFNLVALTYTVSAFASILQQAGLREIFIQRYPRAHLWTGPIFWLSLSIGLVMGLATLGAAPLAARLYEEPRLIGLLALAAVLQPLNALLTVPEAILRAQLRFRYMTLVSMGVGLPIGLPMTLGIAYLGGGAYAILAPTAVTLALRLAIFWREVRPAVPRRLQVRRWRYLLNDSGVTLLASIAVTFTLQGGAIVLGLVFPPPLVAAGIFYFAWNIADQLARLVMLSLSPVLFPALRTLQDEPERQVGAFVRAVRLLLIVGVPLCLGQAILAGPLVRTVFPENKWEPAVLVMSILSIGMIGRVWTNVADSLMWAQRRQKAVAAVSVLHALMFVGLVYAGSVAGPALLPHLSTDAAGATGAAAGAALAMLGGAPISYVTALWTNGRRRGEVWRALKVPVIGGALVFGPAAFIPGLFRGGPTNSGTLNDLLAMAATFAVCAPCFALATRVLAPDDFRELLGRIMGMVRRKR